MLIELPNNHAQNVLDLVRHGAAHLASFPAYETALVFHIQFHAALRDEEERRKGGPPATAQLDADAPTP